MATVYLNISNKVTYLESSEGTTKSWEKWRSHVTNLIRIRISLVMSGLSRYIYSERSLLRSVPCESMEMSQKCRLTRCLSFLPHVNWPSYIWKMQSPATNIYTHFFASSVDRVRCNFFHDHHSSSGHCKFTRLVTDESPKIR